MTTFFERTVIPVYTHILMSIVSSFVLLTYLEIVQIVQEDGVSTVSLLLCNTCTNMPVQNGTKNKNLVETVVDLSTHLPYFVYPNLKP